MKNIKKLNEEYRVTDWIHFLGFTLLGFFYYPQQLQKLPLLLVTSASILAYAYAFNNFVDLRKAKRELITPLIPLIIYLVLLPSLDLYQTFFSLLFVLTATAYSIPVIRLKRFPIIGTLLNPVGFISLFFLGINIERIEITGLLFGSLLFLLELVSQLVHELSHQKSDTKEGLSTTTVFFGEKHAKRICYIMLLLSAAVSVVFVSELSGAVLITAPTIILSVGFLHRLRKKEYKKTRYAFRKGGTIVGVSYLVKLIF